MILNLFLVISSKAKFRLAMITATYHESVSRKRMEGMEKFKKFGKIQNFLWNPKEPPELTRIVRADHFAAEEHVVSVAVLADLRLLLRNLGLH